MKNQVQLIAYVDRFSSGGFRELQSLLGDGPLAGLFGGVHLLPFFCPIDGADAGFDPIDHTQVDPPAWLVGRCTRAGRAHGSDGRSDRESYFEPISAVHRLSKAWRRVVLRIHVPYLRACFRGWRNRSGAIADLSPAAGASLHENAPGRWNRAALVDYVHRGTSGYRRPFPAGQKVPG